MNQQQHKHLMERIDTVYRKLTYYRRDDDAPEPSDVVAARTTIKNYEDKQKAEDNAFHKKVSDARKKAEESVLFGAPDDAIQAVRQFEEAQF